MVAVTTTRLTWYDAVARKVGADAGHRLVQETTVATAIDASGTAPRRTGALSKSQRFRVRRVGLNTHGTIWYPLDYAMSVHEGARPHPIPLTPKGPGQWLVFHHRGRLRFAKQVFHPGQRANPWLFRSLVFEAGRRDFRVLPR